MIALRYFGSAILAGALVVTACAEQPLVPLQSDARFLVIGDFGTGGVQQKQIAQTMCRRASDSSVRYVVSTGDNVYPKGEPEDFNRKFRRPYECLFDRGVRFHSVLGNHDVITDSGHEEVQTQMFGMKGDYYTWTYGPVEFIMLNTNDIEGDRVQLSWMRDRLAAAGSAPWTVVVGHHPVYSSGRHPSTPGFDTLFGEPFERRGVDLVLTGHDHNYQHASAGGIDYFVSGGGGGPLYECQPELIAPVDKCASEYHFLEVSATQSSMSVSAINASGSEIDAYEISRNDPAP